MSLPQGDFVWPVRIYWEDTDAGGVVYYANYLKFLERARSEWLRAQGFEQPALITRHQAMFVVRRVEIDYLQPARFNDALTVRVRPEPPGRARIAVTQSVYCDDRCLCTARVTLAWVSADDFKPARIPPELLAGLAPLSD
jgi:acyl-CoA thioester hydrolase